MKRRFTGIAALGMALTLAFGMTVSAAGSVTAEDSSFSDEALQEAAASTTVESTKVVLGGVEVELTFAAPEAVTKLEQAKVENAITEPDETEKGQQEAALEKLGVKADDVKLTPMASVKISIPSGITPEEVKTVGVKVPIKQAGIKVNHKYLVRNEGEDGTVTYEAATVTAAGSLEITVYHFSTFTIIDCGEEVSDPEPEQPKQPSGDSHWEGGPDYVPDADKTASGAPASPQTGEALPAAGFMAVLCLAGAAVCVKKAHNN